MKSAHFAVVTPGRCGLYETTRELVANLRLLGVDARIFDPTQAKNKLHPGGTGDRGAIFCGEDWMEAADVHVSHSGLAKWELSCTQPVVYAVHGRPRSSFLTQLNGGLELYNYHYNKNKDKRFKQIVTFWPEHVPYLEFMYPDTAVRYVPSCVDLEKWCPGPAEYDFVGKSGSINAVITDSWRDDIDPFVPINAFGVWARGKDNVKLHIYAKPLEVKGWAALIKRLEEDGTLGVYQGWASHLERVYRAADMVLTGNNINVRTVREAMACGCPVVQFPSPDILNASEQLDAALKQNRELIRKRAEGIFNPVQTARKFEGVLQDALH